MRKNFNIVDAYTSIFKNKKRVLVITAHPDDAEINSGGLISRLTKDNILVRLIVATDGSNGNREILSKDKTVLSNTRLESQYKGAKLLGINSDNIFNLGLEDGYVENNHDLIYKLVEQIREFKPDIVITHTPSTYFINHEKRDVYWVNHRDHRNLAAAVVDSIYPFSRDVNFFPDLFRDGFGSHVVSELLFFESYDDISEVFIDITDQLVSKKKSLLAHKKANILTDNDIEVFLTETKKNNRHYERFGYLKIDRLRTVSA